MLLTTAIIAFTAYLIQDYYHVRDAYVRYVYCYNNWVSHRVTINDLVESSEKIALAETDSLWTSAGTAQNRHIGRMNELKADVEGCSWGPLSSPQAIDLPTVNENIRKHQLR